MFEATKTEYLVTVDLGSTLEVEIHADGVPEVVYEWFKLPSGGYPYKFHSFSLDILRFRCVIKSLELILLYCRTRG